MKGCFFMNVKTEKLKKELERLISGGMLLSSPEVVRKALELESCIDAQ